MSHPIVIAHRGASGCCPENTLLAFRTALESGARWLELDVQLIENRLLVFHDDYLDRTTNGCGPLDNYSLNDLRQLDVGAGEKIPFLEEVLDLALGRAVVNIELKGAGTAEATAALLTRLFTLTQLTPEDILVSSLKRNELRRFQELLPQVRRAPVYEKIPHDLDRQLEQFAPWSVHLKKTLITATLARHVQQSGCKLFAWTVNRKGEAEELLAAGVEGFFTDFPERFLLKSGGSE